MTSDREVSEKEPSVRIEVEAFVHQNTSQEIIEITSDKVRLCLANHLKRVEARGGWITPISLFLVFAAALLTADFRDAFGLPAHAWQATFVVLAVLTLLWSVRAMVSAIGASASIEDIIDEMKGKSR